MTNIRRYDPTGRPVFITAVCYRRKRYLETDWQKELLLSVMREVKSSSDFAMHAYVILVDHFHWIITPRKQNFSTIMQSVKLRFVHRFKKAIGQKNNAILWQRRFWDHVIRNAEDLHRHMDYIHFNPVKHEYVSKPLDYKWSSLNTHVKMGNYSANWDIDIISEAIHTMHLE